MHTAFDLHVLCLITCFFYPVAVAVHGLAAYIM